MKKKSNLFLRFVLVLFVGIALLVGLLTYEFDSMLQREMFDLLTLVGRMVGNQAAIVAERELPSEAAFTAAMHDPTFTRFRAIEQAVLRIPEAVRIKIWDTRMRVVYSNDQKIMGKAFPKNEELARALQGRVELMIALLKTERERFYEGHGPQNRLLEAYVPLGSSLGKPPYGVVEVYVYPPTFFAHLDEAKQNLRLISVLGGIGVFLALGGMFWRAWRKEQGLTSQLERAHRFNEDILEHVGTGIVVLDRDFVILSWNKAMERLCGAGVTREDALGRQFFELVPCICKDRLQARLAEVLRTGSSYSLYGQPCLTRENGQETCVNIALIPISDESGQPSKILMSIEDITEVRKLEAQLIHAEKLSLIGEMYAGLTHEINNPLGIMVAKIKLLLAAGRQAGYPHDLMQDLETVDRYSAQIAEILRNLLTFAKRATFEKKDVDVNSLVNEALGLVQKPFARDNVQIHSVLQSDLPTIQGDPNLLQQVLVNLLSNARDALPRGGRIWIRTRRDPKDNGAVHIEVEDEGIGIAPEIADKIFHPFFTTKEVGKGTGLGLSVSYGIVRSHGGDLRVKSHDGAGAIFTIVLPVAVQEG